jgi:hypothetical protein
VKTAIVRKCAGMTTLKLVGVCCYSCGWGNDWESSVGTEVKFEIYTSKRNGTFRYKSNK